MIKLEIKLAEIEQPPPASEITIVSSLWQQYLFLLTDSTLCSAPIDFHDIARAPPRCPERKQRHVGKTCRSGNGQSTGEGSLRTGANR
jgi:hypothetical protein